MFLAYLYRDETHLSKFKLLFISAPRTFFCTPSAIFLYFILAQTFLCLCLEATRYHFYWFSFTPFNHWKTVIFQSAKTRSEFFIPCIKIRIIRRIIGLTVRSSRQIHYWDTEPITKPWVTSCDNSPSDLNMLLNFVLFHLYVK